MSGYMQIRHTDWNENPGCQDWSFSPSYTCRKGYFYSNYLHVEDWVVNAGQTVRKGQLIGHTGLDGRSGFPHLHFEIRAGRSWQKYCCNPWKYLPNAGNDYTSFNADVTLTPNYEGKQCEAAVNISVPPYQLTLNRVELYITSSGTMTKREFDFCKENFYHTLEELDDPEFDEQNLFIYPGWFNSQSYRKKEKASILFVFNSLPSGGGTIQAKAYDVFENVVSTGERMYTC